MYHLIDADDDVAVYTSQSYQGLAYGLEDWYCPNDFGCTSWGEVGALAEQHDEGYLGVTDGCFCARIKE